ncbi:unnamed protein product [Diatraea saccharalis]|uniref:Uncharacterized protein n=1 Tax=Diatraea saccharalis TaxID=40085 RepID=A0A9N9RB20_9NEOP|nr:unnamed protein product [Diatraea saccharalis]
MNIQGLDQGGFPGSSKTCQAKENEVNFEAMAENLIYSQPGAYEPSIKNFESVQEETLQVVEQQGTVQIISSVNSDIMLANQILILNKLNLIIENKKKIGQKMASLSVQLDETNESTRQLQQEQQCNVTLLKDASSEERESFSLKAIETKED